LGTDLITVVICTSPGKFQSMSSASWYEVASKLGFKEGDISFDFSGSLLGDTRDVPTGRGKERAELGE
jgi:hypothetical protein